MTMFSSFRFDQLFYFLSILTAIILYFVRLEHRLTRIEIKLENISKIINSRSKTYFPPL